MNVPQCHVIRKFRILFGMTQYDSEIPSSSLQINMNLLIEVHIAFVRFILLITENSKVNLSQVVVTLYHSSCRLAVLLPSQG
jgi:hypothetical protein